MSSPLPLGRAPHAPRTAPGFYPLLPWGGPTPLPSELHEAGVQLVGVELLKLLMRPGLDALRRLGGLHRWLGWDGPVLAETSLDRLLTWQPGPGRPHHARLLRLDDQGVTVASPVDGARHRFTPEEVAEAATVLGADMLVPLRPPLAAPRWPPERLSELDQRWRERGRAALPEGPLILGPDDRHRLAGGREEVVSALAQGAHLVGSDAPFRLARAGLAYTPEGELDLADPRLAEAFLPIDADCPCGACRRFTRAYLHHLTVAGELLGPRLLALHNLTVLAQLGGSGARE